MYSERPIVSIVIPVYNTETFLRRCLDSACEQTLKNIEIIIVNDGSTDGSGDICTEFSVKDSRIKVITHEKNLGPFQARISGVEIATGIYVHFVDSDDFIALDCEEKIWANSQDAAYDIIGFNAVFFSSQSAEIDPLYEARINRSEELTFRGMHIFEDFFCRPDHYSCMWAKWFRNELAEKVVAMLCRDYYCMAEDFYFCTVATFLAEFERHVPLSVYHYNICSGVSNQSSFTGLAQFKPVLSMLSVLINIKKFLVTQGVFERYAINFKYWEDAHIESVLFRFGKIRNQPDKKKALELILVKYDPTIIVQHLCRAYFGKERELADLLYDSPIMAVPRRKIKTLAVFYYRISNGGVERVLSKLIPLYMQLGYKVILFTDCPPSKEDYNLPDGIERVVFSNPICDIPQAKIHDRQQEWREAIKKYNIDAVIYNAHVDPRILWELITIKLEKVKFLVASHGLFSYPLHVTYIKFPYYYYYRLADAMTCLSRIDELWWRGCGINCRYVPNPISFTQIPAQQFDVGDSKNILWIGRISEEKQPVDAIKAFACAIKRVPDAKLIVVGAAESWDKQNEIMKQTAQELGVADNVVFAGFSKNVEHFFQDTAIHIFTSKFEGFGMVLIEAKLYGIPTVSYNLPYIEPLRCTNGNIIVPQGDFRAMGDAMADLLENRQYRKELGAEGKESLKYFINYPLSETWDEIIRLAGNGENFLLSESVPFEDVRIMSETLHEGLERFHALSYNTLSELNGRNIELAELLEREVKFYQRELKYYQDECRNNPILLAEQQELLNHRLLRAAAKIDKLSKRFFPNNGGIRKVAKVGWEILRWEYQILRKCLKLNKC